MSTQYEKKIEDEELFDNDEDNYNELNKEILDLEKKYGSNEWYIKLYFEIINKWIFCVLF